MGSLLCYVKISEDLYMLFSGFVIQCFFSAELIKQKQKPWVFLIPKVNLFQGHFSRSFNY